MKADSKEFVHFNPVYAYILKLYCRPSETGATT